MALPELLHMAEAVSAAPAPGAIPEADADGTLNRWAAGAGMPGARKINLSVDLTSYTAPADGYLYARKENASSIPNSLHLYDSNGFESYGLIPGLGWAFPVWLPCKKGEVLTIRNLNDAGSINKVLIFFYAEGAV